MASGHVNRIKKVLANLEPSTHGPSRKWRDVRHESVVGG